jgi:lysozyme
MATKTRPDHRLIGALAGIILSFVVAVPVLAGEPSGSRTPARSGQDILMQGLRAPGLGVDSPPPITEGPDARQGIDVSHWQGRVNWKLVAGSGIDFAIAKATQGTWLVDEWYARNASRARSQGIRFTAYHFAQPTSRTNSAVRQARFFLKHAKLTSADLVPALDVERSGGLSPVALRRWVRDWLREVYLRIGVKVIVYSNPSFWRSALADTSLIAQSGYEVLWLAHWDTLRPSVPARRWNGNGWTIWQWTECGHVPGVHTCVDRDAIIGTPLRTLTIGYLKGLARD